MDDKSFEALVAKVQSYNPKFDIEKLTKAYELADKAHEGQKRNTGEPYIIHPLAVAHIWRT